jgi:hypothetical protein
MLLKLKNEKSHHYCDHHGINQEYVTIRPVAYVQEKYNVVKSRNITLSNLNSQILWYISNTELAIYALDQVYCWGAYFRPGIGHYENFTPLNFQPLLFSKQ